MRAKYLTAAMLMLATPALAQTQVRNYTPTDCSGTITTGGTAQTIIPANTGVAGFMITNIDTAEPMWFRINGTAAGGTQGSYPLQAATATTFASPGSFYSAFGYNTAITVVAATTGHKFSCTRW